MLSSMSGGSAPRRSGSRPVWRRWWARWRQAELLGFSWWCCAAGPAAVVVVAGLGALARVEHWAGARPALGVVAGVALLGAITAYVRLHPEEQRLLTPRNASAPAPPAPGWITWSIPDRAALRERHAATAALRRALVAGGPIDPAARPPAGQLAHGMLARSTTRVIGATMLLCTGALQLIRPHPDLTWVVLSAVELVLMVLGWRGAVRWRRIAADPQLVDPPPALE